MTKDLAFEFAPKGVRVNALQPGGSACLLQGGHIPFRGEAGVRMKIVPRVLAIVIKPGLAKVTHSV